MLSIGQMNLVKWITKDCSFNSKVYQQMKILVGFPRAIYFKLILSKYRKLPANFDLMWFSIALLELQNPKLMHVYKEYYTLELKEVFFSLSIEDRDAINEYIEILIYGRS